jgi:tRNA threonylcarbamoyladenosine biosynthesis protein TsaE
MTERSAQTHGPEETEALAAALAARLVPGDVVLVSGEVGAGKTTFVRGACRALGVHGRVTSPTFTLARRYEDGRVPISHLDLYRLAEAPAGDPALLEDDLDPERVAFVEWPEASAAPADPGRVVACVRLEHAGGDRRTVTIRERGR